MEDEMIAKVLVIMATYNGEKYLQEQLDSILRQKNIQVDILVRMMVRTIKQKKFLSAIQKQ